MFIPRDYQTAAEEAGLDALAEGRDSLIVIPTGGGKSGVIGRITRRLIDEFDGLRIVNLAHVAELVDQAFRELIGMWDWAPAGVYQAQLGRRELHSRILFAGIQSIHRKVAQLGQVDVLMIDEAHTIPRSSDSMYGAFIKALRQANPNMRLLGLTATPYRLDSGRLDETSTKINPRTGVPEDIPPIFEDVAYEVSVRHLIDEGWLAPLTTKETQTTLDVTGVHRQGGDFKQGELQAKVDTDELNRAVAAEIAAKGQDKRSWLVFATGVEHAEHLHQALTHYGFRGGVIVGDTPSAQRTQMIAAFRRQELRYLINCGVLTTGFDAKAVDLLAMVRPTESTGLYVQIAGRGTRPVYPPGFNPNTATREERLAAIAAGPKPKCLVLDFAGNIKRHGPIDMVQPRKPGKGGGEAPVKTCPPALGGCSSVVHASLMDCPDCGFHWERELSKQITRTAAAAPILSRAEPEWVQVARRSWHRHVKLGSPDSVRVEYWRGMSVVAKEFFFPEHPKVRWKAERVWRNFGGAEPLPRDVTEWLQRIGELKSIAEIRIEPDGRYYSVTGHKWGGDAEDTVQTGNLGGSTSYRDDYLLDEEIPF